jgi:Ca2+-binding EF-hand superfamily protein
MKMLMMSSAVALLLSGAAYAADVKWDTNADGQIDREEFNAAMQAETSTFKALDADQSGTLSQDEFNAGVNPDASKPLAFGDWDADQNSELSQDEFDEGAWSSFDADASGSLSMDEANSIGDAIRSGKSVSQ